MCGEFFGVVWLPVVKAGWVTMAALQQEIVTPWQNQRFAPASLLNY